MDERLKLCNEPFGAVGADDIVATPTPDREVDICLVQRGRAICGHTSRRQPLYINLAFTNLTRILDHHSALSGPSFILGPLPAAHSTLFRQTLAATPA